MTELAIDGLFVVELFKDRSLKLFELELFPEETAIFVFLLLQKVLNLSVGFLFAHFLKQL
jgi:hypothetical protein